MRKPRNESKLKQAIRNTLLINPLMIYKTVNGELLTKDATRVLMCCIYDVDDMTYNDYEIQPHFIDAYLGNKMTSVEIYSSLKYLEKLGLIEDLHGDKDNYRFNPTHEGMHFFELRRKNSIYLFVNSILLPIIISIITTLFTMLISAVL